MSINGSDAVDIPFHGLLNESRMHQLQCIDVCQEGCLCGLQAFLCHWTIHFQLTVRLHWHLFSDSSSSPIEIGCFECAQINKTLYNWKWLSKKCDATTTTSKSIQHHKVTCNSVSFLYQWMPFSLRNNEFNAKKEHLNCCKRKGEQRGQRSNK